ncbi:MAG TPA: hypothetical protein VFR89_06745 [candidate division Zixibacteria bacterium]|nr:hypothetical protein [candidate division Zixibacteria bacterium]
MACLIALPLSASADRRFAKRLNKDAVPCVVHTDFNSAYPGAKVKGYSQVDIDGRTYYQMESRDGRTPRYIIYREDGSIFETREVVKVKSMPANVWHAVSRDYPRNTMNWGERVTRGSVVRYNVIVRDGSKRTHMWLDNTGNFLTGVGNWF